MERHLLPCECGGKFSKGSSPRCPKCKGSLSADSATGYIEAQSPVLARDGDGKATGNDFIVL